jgi:hypothetical protein
MKRLYSGGQEGLTIPLGLPHAALWARCPSDRGDRMSPNSSNTGGAWSTRPVRTRRSVFPIGGAPMNTLRKLCRTPVKPRCKAATNADQLDMLIRPATEWDSSLLRRKPTAQPDQQSRL